MQIKITVKYCYIPIKTVKIQNTETTKYCQENGETGPLLHCW